MSRSIGRATRAVAVMGAWAMACPATPTSRGEAGAPAAEGRWGMVPGLVAPAAGLTAVGLLGALALRESRRRLRAERDCARAALLLDRTRDEAARQADALVLARDRALAAERAKGTFLANISHEIRTPMTGLIATADLLARTRLDRAQLELVETIRSSGQVLQALLDDVLDLSKVEAGRLGLVLEPVDLRALVEDVAVLLAPTAHRKGLRLHGLVSADVPARVVGDPMRLRQILLNLVGNAVKFTDAGEVAVEVRRPAGADHGGPGGVPLVISVRDTGIGIAPEHHEAVFRSFSRVEDAPGGRRRGGTGLGLTISRHLAHLMGGRIELESAPGSGSTFRLVVTLPRAEADGTETGPAGPPELRGLAVLVVAPDDLGREAIVEHLRSWGCRAEAVDRPESARARIASASPGERPGLIVLDAEMAGAMDRPTGPGPSPPRVLVHRLGAADGGGAAGMPTVREPVRRSSLQEAICEALRPIAIGEGAPDRAPLPQLGLRILLAEDYETNRELVGQMLRLLGCRADAVPDGASAVAAAARGGYDLILMDLEMPGLDGLQATAEIRRLERPDGCRTPIFAFTAHALEDDRLRCLDRGMDGILAKPLRLAALQSFLADFAASLPRRRPPG